MFEDMPAHGARRNAWLTLGGFALLIGAAVFLLFGGNLLARPQRPSARDLAGSVPALNGARPLSELAEANRLAPPAAGSLAVGDPAPDFTLVNLEGEPVRLADTRGQTVILNFWATWCPPCRVEMPDLQAAYERHAADGLVILALDQDESAEQVHAFFDQMGLTFTPLLDVANLVADRYGVHSYPTSIFLDTEGRIVAIHRGLMTGEQLDGYLAPLLAAAP